jgi:Domain of unknown function (DUF4118)
VSDEIGAAHAARWFSTPTGRWWLRRAAIVVAAAAVPVAAAVALVPFRSDVPNATVALVLAALVTVLAATTDRVAAAAAGLSAALSFDTLHTRPYGSLTIDRAQDIETTVLLLLVAVTVGQLAARNHRHQRMAVLSALNLGRVHAVAEMVAAGASPRDVVHTVEGELKAVLRLRKCWYDPAFAEAPGPFIERNGAVSWGAIRWGFTTIGLPTAEVSLVVEHDARPLGRFVLAADPGTRVTEDELVTAVALADQAGSSLAHETSRS